MEKKNGAPLPTQLTKFHQRRTLLTLPRNRDCWPSILILLYSENKNYHAFESPACSNTCENPEQLLISMRLGHSETSISTVLLVLSKGTDETEIF